MNTRYVYQLSQKCNLKIGGNNFIISMLYIMLHKHMWPTSLIAYLKTLRNASFKNLKCYSLPMVKATCTKFSQVYTNSLPSRKAIVQVVNSSASTILDSYWFDVDCIRQAPIGLGLGLGGLGRSARSCLQSERGMRKDELGQIINHSGIKTG